MTLRWEKTAADCRVGEYLAPMISHHFTYRQGRWATRDDSDYPRPYETTFQALYRLIQDLRDMLPEGRFWDRPRHRMNTSHGVYLTRRLLEAYLSAREFGMSCTCGDACRYPQEPR